MGRCRRSQPVEDNEPFKDKMERLTGELSEMFERSRELEGEIRIRLKAIGFNVGKEITSEANTRT
jgi:hypothetical protein